MKTPAEECIRHLNNERMLVPLPVLEECSKIISRAATLSQEPAAINFLFLVHWNPQQKVN